MALVLDASVAIALLLDEEELPFSADSLLRLKTERLVVPAHWPLEVTNALLANERAGRVRRSRVAQSMAMLAELDIDVYPLHHPLGLDEAFQTVLELARLYQLTAYDAEYLRQAQMEHLDLATLDRALRRAAIEAGVEVLE